MLEHTLELCRELYNAALQERRDAWRIAHKSVRYYDQQYQMVEVKKLRPDLNTVYSQILIDVLRRVDWGFEAFFRRIKAGERAGYPRFLSRSRYKSFTFPQFGFAIDKNGKLRLSKIGCVKIKLHRPIEGKIKTLTIKRTATGKWYAVFVIECEQELLPQSLSTVGIDCGLEKFATLSNGESIANPRFFRASEKQLSKARRRWSKAKKGSPERKKRQKAAARIYERISNQRRDFAHKESRRLVNRFGVIIFEKLNIRAMIRNHCFAKSITDAAWNQLILFTSNKAENAGRCVVQVNPRNTSQRCSGCSEIVEKDLSVRVHDCPSCGLVLDRDHNAAINIERLGLQSLGTSLEAVSKMDSE